MSTEGLPFILADKTGSISSSEFDDIYDRMFLCTTCTSVPSDPSPSSLPNLLFPTTSRLPWYPSSPTTSPKSDLEELPSVDLPSASQGTRNVITIYQLSHRPTRAERAHPEMFSNVVRPGVGGVGAGKHDTEVVLEFGPNGALGTVTFVGDDFQSKTLRMSSWLRRSAMFASTLSRKFVALDGRSYKWEYQPKDMQYEWACTSSEGLLVAHYVLNPEGQPTYRTSGNMLTIHEEIAPIAIELLASLTIMRHIEQNL